MNYIHFGNTFSKNTELLIKGCIYINCMEYHPQADELDIDLLDHYIYEGYQRYLNSDTLNPFLIGDAIWHAFYDYLEYVGDADENPIDIYAVHANLDKYIEFRLCI